MAGALQHSPADVVRRLLIAKGIGTDPDANQAWPVFAGGSPDAPDSAIIVYDQLGFTQGRHQRDGETQERHGLQFIVRAAAYATGFRKARAITELLDKGIYQSTQSIDGSRYVVQSIGRTSDVISQGKQAPGVKRSAFSINALATLRQVA